MNNSATGGLLQPGQSDPFSLDALDIGFDQGYLDGPGVIEDSELDDFLQALVAGVTGLPGPLVRPRWQPEPPDSPPYGQTWAAIGVVSEEPDAYPYVAHSGAGDGVDMMQRHERLEIVASFYGPQARSAAKLLRDGLYVPQNREILLLNNMGLIGVGRLSVLPSLVKERWLYRADLSFTLRREVQRSYPVENLLGATVSAATKGVSITVTTAAPFAIGQGAIGVNPLG